MNIKQLMKQAQQMQEQMQQQMSNLQVEATAGGMVKATMSGNKELISLTIDKEAVDPNDVEMLQDLVLAAVNEASRKVDEAMQSQVSGLTGGMKMPGF